MTLPATITHLCRSYGMPRWMAVMGEAQSWRCPLCSRRMRVEQPQWLDKDHLTPRSRGGSDGPDNLRLVHKQCNRTKGDMTLDEFRAWQSSGMSKSAWRAEAARQWALGRRRWLARLHSR